MHEGVRAGTPEMVLKTAREAGNEKLSGVMLVLDATWVRQGPR